MRAYLSYSISEDEHYLASILSGSLWENGFVATGLLLSMNKSKAS